MVYATDYRYQYYTLSLHCHIILLIFHILILEMFGEAKFGVSVYGKPILIHETLNSVYEFSCKNTYTSAIGETTKSIYVLIFVHKFYNF